MCASCGGARDSAMPYSTPGQNRCIGTSRSDPCPRCLGGVRGGDMSPDETVCEVDLELVVRSAVRRTLRPTSVSRRAGTHRPTSEAGQRPGERGVRQEHGDTERSEEVTRPRLVQTGVDHRWRRDDGHDTASRTRGTSGDRTRGSRSFSDSRRPTLRLALRVERSQALGISVVAWPAPPPSAGAKREWDPVSDVPTAAVVC